MKKISIWIVSILLLTAMVFFNLDNIYRSYIYLFKKTIVVKHYNRNGKYDGETIGYFKGRVYFSANFKNGMREGWAKKYYTNGSLKTELFYKDDKLNGIEKEYYENGILNYTVNWKNSYMVGSEYHYSKDSKLINYDSFDINNNDINRVNIICYAEYSPSGKLIKLIGDVFGDNIYSKSKNDNSTIILNDNKEYSHIRDLYLTVATPAGLISQVEININDNKYDDLKVQRNTVLVPNAFPYSGKFSISIYGKFISPDKKIIKTDTLKRLINVVY